MSSYYLDSQGGGGDVTSFRDTVLSSRPRTGRRQFVPPKPQTALVMGSESLAAELSPQRRLSHRPVAGPGGKDHMSREGGSIVANEEQLNHAVHAAATASPRSGKPLSSRTTVHNAGGPDHIKFDDGETVVYTCGVKEAQMRLALEPELKASAEAQGSAGGRVAPKELGYRRRQDDPSFVPSRPVHNAGGEDHMSTVWADPVGPAAYKESVAEAQARLAHDPLVRQDAEKVAMAGRRVEAKWLGESIRTTRPIGGHSSFALGWNERGGPRQPNDAPSNSVSGGAPFATDRDLTEKARILRPEQTVGGRSGLYLEGASVKDNGAGRPATAVANARPPPAHARGFQDSRGVGGIFDWNNSSSASSDSGRLRTIHAPSDAGAAVSSGTPGGGASSAVSRLRREQPLGGRGLVGINLQEEVGAKRPGTASHFPAHQQSSIIF